MKAIRALLTGISVVVLSSTVCLAEEATMHKPEDMPKPVQQHQWLQQFVGEWESETEAMMPGEKEPMVVKGSESIRPLGGFWTITEVKSTMMDKPFTGNMTLGYDAQKQKYVGTWVDSLTGQLWEYEGNVDPSGKVLTLESEGACPMRPGKITKFKEVLEVKGKDEKTYTSSMQDDNGQWVTMMTSRAHRKSK